MFRTGSLKSPPLLLCSVQLKGRSSKMDPLLISWKWWILLRLDSPKPVEIRPDQIRPSTICGESKGVQISHDARVTVSSDCLTYSGDTYPLSNHCAFSLIYFREKRSHSWNVTAFLNPTAVPKISITSAVTVATRIYCILTLLFSACKIQKYSILIERV